MPADLKNPVRIAAYVEYNRLMKILGRPAQVDHGSLSLAQVQSKVTALTAEVAALKPKPTTPTPPPPTGGIKPVGWDQPVVTTPTPIPSNVSVVTPTVTPSTNAPTRSSLLREINNLRAKLGLDATTLKDSDTLASLQKQVTNLKYTIDHPAIPATTGTGSSVVGTTTSSGTSIGGDATKKDLVKQIDNLASALGIGSTGINPDTMNRTQLVNILEGLQAQAPASTLQDVQSASMTSDIAGIPKNVLFIAGGGLILLAVLKRKKGK